MDAKHLIEPENQQIWIVSGMIIAMLALVLSLISLHRTNKTIRATQAQVLLLNQKIETVTGVKGAPAAAAAPAPAPAASK